MSNPVSIRRSVINPQPIATLDRLEPRTLYSASPLSSTTLPNHLTAAVVVSADAYEVNNAASTAHDLTTSEGSLSDVAGLATATDNDWYRVRAGEGRFEAELQSIATEGELNLQVFTADGELLGGNYRVEDDSVVELDLAEDTELLLFVYGKGGYQGNAYNLTWNAVDPSAGSTGPAETTPPAETNGPTEPAEPAAPTEPAASVAGAADRFEANQSRQTATVLSGAGGSISATATDTDFYRVDAPAGEVTFTLTSVVSEGELNIELYDNAGTRLTGRYNIEPVSEVTVNLDVEGPVFALIYARGGFQGNVYELAWTGGGSTEPTAPTQPTRPTQPTEPTQPVDPTAPVAGTADRFESNQSRETATVLSGSTGSLAATATDTDFYRLDAAAGEVTFTLTADVAEGDLNLELYDADGVFLTGRYNVEPVSEVSLTLDADGPILAFIYAKGGFQGNVYELAWAGGGPTEPTEPAEPTAPTEPTRPTQPTEPNAANGARQPGRSGRRCRGQL